MNMPEQPSLTVHMVQAFMSDMVGTPEQTERFQSHLREALWTSRERSITQQAMAPEGWVYHSGNMNPYSVLYGSLTEQLTTVQMAQYRTAGMYIDPGSSDFDRYQAAIEKTHRNGLVGFKAIVMALNGLGRVYSHNAARPQARTTVANSMGSVLRTTQAIAFSDAKRGSRNMRAMVTGTNPKHPLAAIIRGGGLKATSPTTPFAERSFSVIDHNGQLSVALRFEPLRSPVGGARCPATAAKVASEKGTAPALTILHKAVGEVVLDEVYPYMFDIIPAE